MKNLKITPPEGYEIDKEQSTFENIVFKPLKKALPKTWEELKNVQGYCIDLYANTHLIDSLETRVSNSNVFVTKKQAEASIALAQLSQLMDVYNDGWVPDWTDNKHKYVIYIQSNKIEKTFYSSIQSFLAFKTEELRDEFIENFKDLILTAKPLL